MCFSRCVARDPVVELLAGDVDDFPKHALVGVKAIGQLGAVLLNDDPGSLLHGFDVNTTHVGECGKGKKLASFNSLCKEKKGLTSQDTLSKRII